MVPFLLVLTTYGFATLNFRVPIKLLVILFINAGLPESDIALNCQKEPFDRGGTLASMSLAVALFLIPKTNCAFFSR
jgi:hypothetical protein